MEKNQTRIKIRPFQITCNIVLKHIYQNIYQNIYQKILQNLTSFSFNVEFMSILCKQTIQLYDKTFLCPDTFKRKFYEMEKIK